MKGRQVVLGRLFGREAAALIEDGQLVDLLADPAPLTPLAPGAICRGVAERLMKGQGGIFVRLPDGQTGYLRDRRGIAEGKPLLVQVAGVAESGKAIPLTNRLIFRGRHALVTPEAPGINVSRKIREADERALLEELGRSVLADRGHGLILRSAAELAEEEEIAEELSQLLDLADRICGEAASGGPELLLDAASPWEQAWSEWAEPAPDAVEEGDDSFDRCGVLDAVDALLTPLVPLGAGDAVIEATRALVAVDVNTRNDSSPAAALKVNIALARDLPRQLRLRGLGGQVVVDFAPMPKRDRATLDQVLQAAFRASGTETTLVGWTTMGLFELSRKRDRVPLARLAAAEEA